MFLFSQCSSILSKCPSHEILPNLISLIIICLLVDVPSHSLVLIFQEPSACSLQRLLIKLYTSYAYWAVVAVRSAVGV